MKHWVVRRFRVCRLAQPCDELKAGDLHAIPQETCSLKWICVIIDGYPFAGEMLRSAFYMALGPLLAAILYFVLNNPWVVDKLR